MKLQLVYVFYEPNDEILQIHMLIVPIYLILQYNIHLYNTIKLFNFCVWAHTACGYG